MSKIVVLFVCLAVFKIVSALECYYCDNQTCKQDMKQWQKTKCGGSPDANLDTVCQKWVYKDKDGKEMVSRTCAIVLKSGEAVCPEAPQGATDSKCPVCKTDLCNSA